MSIEATIPIAATPTRPARIKADRVTPLAILSMLSLPHLLPRVARPVEAGCLRKLPRRGENPGPH